MMIMMNFVNHVIFRQGSWVKIMLTLFAVRQLYKGNAGKWITLFVPILVANRKTHTQDVVQKKLECTLLLVLVKFT